MFSKRIACMVSPSVSLTPSTSDNKVQVFKFRLAALLLSVGNAFAPVVISSWTHCVQAPRSATAISMDSAPLDTLALPTTKISSSDSIAKDCSIALSRFVTTPSTSMPKPVAPVVLTLTLVGRLLSSSFGSS